MRGHERVWYRAPRDLFEGDNALKFFPTSSMTVHSQLNAILRFCIYYSVIMTVLTTNPRHLLVALFGAALTALVSEIAYNGREDAFRHDTSEVPTCVQPSVDNPYMNFRAFDARDRRPACKPWNVEQDISAAAGEPIQDSPFQKPFDRFYTMPCTTAANDQSGFANWLYGSMPGKYESPQEQPTLTKQTPSLGF